MRSRGVAAQGTFGEPMLRRLVGRAAGATALAGAGWCAYKHNTDEGFRRAVRLYTGAGPPVVHYRAVELKQRLFPPSEEAAAAEWRALDLQYAKPMCRLLEELQGMYTKYGQIGAGLTNTFSKTWIEELRRLEDAVPPRPKEVVMKTILEETGKTADELFSSFDETPLGSASIGQVHRATLRSDGSEVAVKVQYPDAAELFRSDMATIRNFLSVAAPEQVIILAELERQFELEFDYTHEAACLTEVASNMRRHGFMPREVVVPLPRAELTTRRVLVMELLPGVKMLDGLRSYGEIVARSQGKTLDDLEAEMRAKIEREGIPARYDGPSAAQIEGYLRWMRLRDGAVNAALLCYNWSVGLLLGRAAYWSSAAPPNAPRLMDVLMRVHGAQLLADGVFQADPHAGNFLMLPDDRIGLIDYGATKRLSRSERLSACVMYAALGRRDEDVLLDLAATGGYKSKHMNKEVLLKLMRFGCDTFGKDLLGEKNIQQFIDELYAEDPYEEVADNLVMAQFLSIRLRTVGMGMNHPVVCSDWWGPMAEEVLRAEGLPYETWDRAQMERELKAGVRMATAKGRAKLSV